MVFFIAVSCVAGKEIGRVWAKVRCMISVAFLASFASSLGKSKSMIEATDKWMFMWAPTISPPTQAIFAFTFNKFGTDGLGCPIVSIPVWVRYG